MPYDPKTFVKLPNHTELWNKWKKDGIDLLKHKYIYYFFSNNIIEDSVYDAQEAAWYALGETIGRSKVRTPYWVGFNQEHPWAEEAIKEAKLAMLEVAIKKAKEEHVA